MCYRITLDSRSSTWTLTLYRRHSVLVPTLDRLRLNTYCGQTRHLFVHLLSKNRIVFNHILLTKKIILSTYSRHTVFCVTTLTLDRWVMFEHLPSTDRIVFLNLHFKKRQCLPRYSSRGVVIDNVLSTELEQLLFIDGILFCHLLSIDRVMFEHLLSPDGTMFAYPTYSRQTGQRFSSYSSQTW